MLKRVIFLFLVILAGCSNPPAQKEIVKTEPGRKPKAKTVNTVPSFWTVNSFAPREGAKEGSKYVKFVTEGNFSDSTQTAKYLYAEVYVNKKNAGIFLHKLKKSSPAEKFIDPVQIKMTNSSGQELQMTSTRRWNSSGGIMIESNNNDYSQMRIFLLQNTGTVKVEIRDPEASMYYFNMYLDGFSDSFSKI